ncbi:cold shock domain-containing protein [Candidatus Poribacteria bacterium]|nr:cold shock domain-containing protein [Candidatus Poribacteria bacterium]
MIEKKISHLLRRTQGQIKWFDENKGYGFIISEEHYHREIFVHKSQIMDDSISLKPCQKVKFDIRQTNKGLSAVNVVPIKEWE